MEAVLDITKELVNNLLFLHLLLICFQIYIKPFFTKKPGTTQNRKSKNGYIQLLSTTYLSSI